MTTNLGRAWPRLLIVFAGILALLLAIGFERSRTNALADGRRRAVIIADELLSASRPHGQSSLRSSDSVGQPRLAGFLAEADDKLRGVRLQTDFRMYVYERDGTAFPISSTNGSLVETRDERVPTLASLHVPDRAKFAITEGVGKVDVLEYPSPEDGTHFVAARLDADSDRLMVVDASEAGIIDRAYETPRTLMVLLLVGIAGVLPPTVYRLTHRGAPDTGQTSSPGSGIPKQESSR
jgi:hypothetical protein